MDRNGQTWGHSIYVDSTAARGEKVVKNLSLFSYENLLQTFLLTTHDDINVICHLKENFNC